MRPGSALAAFFGLRTKKPTAASTATPAAARMRGDGPLRDLVSATSPNRLVEAMTAASFSAGAGFGSGRSAGLGAALGAGAGAAGLTAGRGRSTGASGLGFPGVKKGEMSEPGSPGVSVFRVAGSTAGAAEGAGGLGAGAGSAAGLGLAAAAGAGGGTGLGFSTTGAGAATGLGALTLSFSRSRPARADLRKVSISGPVLPLPFPFPFPLPFTGLGSTAVRGAAASLTTDLRSSSARASYLAAGGASWRTGAGTLTFGISLLRRSRSAGRANSSSSDRALSFLRGGAGAALGSRVRSGAGAAATAAAGASVGSAAGTDSGRGSGLPRTASTEASSSAILRGFSKYSAAPYVRRASVR